MIFDEFLMNSNSMLYDAVKAYETKRPLNTQIHNLAMEQVYKHMLIGGMPEAVEGLILMTEIFWRQRNSKKFCMTITLLIWNCIGQAGKQFYVHAPCFRIFTGN